MKGLYKARNIGDFSFALLALAGLGTFWGLRVLSRRQSRFNFYGKSVVVTGGSRGLGLVIARQLAAEGARLALLAEGEEDLSRASRQLSRLGVQVIAIPCDVRDQVQVQQALSQVVATFGSIDVLINNAGVIQVGPLLNMGIEDFQEAMDVHFWGPLFTTWEALVYMRQNGGGRIVNISSIGGQVAVPHLAPYTASKFALTGLSDALRVELAKEQIYVTTISPGLMRTGSHVNAQFKGQHEKEYAWFSISGALPITSIQAEKAARQIIEACRSRKPDLVITPQARLLILVNTLFPHFFARASQWVNRLLPNEASKGGNRLKSGWESQSRWSPSILTTLADRAALDNNQVRGKGIFLKNNFKNPVQELGGNYGSRDL